MFLPLFLLMLEVWAILGDHSQVLRKDRRPESWLVTTSVNKLNGNTPHPCIHCTRSQPEAHGADSVCHHSLRGQGQAWAGYTEKELRLSYQTRQAPPAVPQEKELFKV